MARGRFTAHVDLATMRQLKAKRKLILNVSQDDEAQIKDMLRVYEKDAMKRTEAGEQPRRIAFLWDVAYGKRSLGKNNLTWALLTLTVRLMNEGMPDGKEKLTPVQLYNQDMGDVAPCRGIEVDQNAIPWLQEAGEVRIKNIVPVEGTTRVIAYVIKTSSKWDDQEAHRYIEYLFNRLAMMGIPLPADQVKLKEWWFEWMETINDSRLDLHAEELSKDQYRKLHPLCEGCMKFIGQGGGQIAHIKSVGAGGEQPQLAKGSEWLHLCAECHIGIVHAKGWGEFKELHPHLTNKIDRALAAPALGHVEGEIMKSHTRPGGVRVIDEMKLTGVSVEGQPELFDKPSQSLADFDDDPLHPIF